MRTCVWLVSIALLGACSGNLGGAPSGPGSGDDDEAASPRGDAGRTVKRDGGSKPDATTGEDEPAAAPAKLPARVYVAKVKSLLTGLPATGEEIAAVESNPGALKDQIAGWQGTPEYQRRMLDFFTTAFQQGDVTAEMVLNASPFEQGALDPRVIQNMRESFARTAFQLVSEGRPFTEVLTTRRFMLTEPLMMAMAWLDERISGDGGGVSDALDTELGPNASYTLQGDTKVDILDSTTPGNPNFFKFYSAQVAAATGDCKKPIKIDHEQRITLYTMTMGETLMNYFMGAPFGLGFCRYPARDNVFTDADFQRWRMVTLRQPRANEKVTWVYELGKFRSSPELVFRRPYVGFYTTPSFLYTWQTNSSNQARVTINQTIITAVGQKFDGSHTADPVSEAAVELAHAKPGTACYGCHIAMDPMRQFFRANYTLYWSVQQDKKQTALPGVFVLNDQTAMGGDIASLGTLLANSGRFASAWAGKLCIWANGAVCDPSGDSSNAPSDPELQRIVQVFIDSHYDWNTLVRELFASPLVTYAEETDTSRANGTSYAIAKKAHLCQLWDRRLGLDDVCGMRALPTTASGDAIKTIATVLPSDSYSRGQTTPTLANDPGMFFFAGVENACSELAKRVVDPAKGGYRSSAPDDAIADMVHTLMGVPAPDDAEPLQILRAHFDEASKTVGAADALRSTFVIACLSPSTVSVGQ